MSIFFYIKCSLPYYALVTVYHPYFCTPSSRWVKVYLRSYDFEYGNYDVRQIGLSTQKHQDWLNHIINVDKIRACYSVKTFKTFHFKKASHMV